MTKPTIWAPIQQLDISSLDQAFLTLFQSQASLTKALKAQIKKSFQIQLLHQSWMQKDLQKHEVVFVREVFSVGDDMPWVFGRSVIPKNTFFAEPKIQTLQLKPLGEILFNSSRIHRDSFSFAKITKENIEYQQVTRHVTVSSSYLWARRSTFWFDQNPLFLTEIFLPELFANIF